MQKAVYVMSYPYKELLFEAKNTGRMRALRVVFDL